MQHGPRKKSLNFGVGPNHGADTEVIFLLSLMLRDRAFGLGRSLHSQSAILVSSFNLTFSSLKFGDEETVLIANCFRSLKADLIIFLPPLAPKAIFFGAIYLLVCCLSAGLWQNHWPYFHETW